MTFAIRIGVTFLGL